MPSQNVMSSKVICFGELMMRLNAPSHQRFQQAKAWEIFYGGSEANVSVLLSRLGTESALVTCLPDNDLGQSALESVRSHGVDTSHIIRTGDRLGLYFTETSNSIRPSRVIYDRKDSAFSVLAPGMIPWENIFKQASWFHWSGISAAVSPGAAAVCLEALKAAKRSGLKISADLNHRTMLWKYGKHPSQVMPELLSYCDWIGGDIDTAEIYFGINIERSLSRELALEECGRKLKEKLPHMEGLAMSFRETKDAGSQLYSGILMREGKLYSSVVHEFANIIERIGSGDAFMGGLIYSVLNGADDQDTIDFAVAAGVLKHSIPGEFTIVSKHEIKNFLTDGNAKGKIIR
jgi:2-dehydro-3-deoxygluconokinase